jgi:glycosyltransferase involved in cell wall biosynthesis
MMLNPRGVALSLEYHLLKKEGAPLRRLIPPSLQSSLRRRARAAYLLWEGRSYRAWINEHSKRRSLLYAHPVESGLLSVLTPVWDGSPLEHLKTLAESIIAQNTRGTCEWLILSNGCTKPDLIAYLDALNQYRWVTLIKSEENVGIVRGLRLCLEQAKGRYALAVDADDRLYPDCFQVVSSWIKKTHYPVLLYTDEDKLLGHHAVQPYLKPDFDPVLLLNSAYIAHLGVFDRQTALNLGAYSDSSTEGSADWDLFVRFFLAGHKAVHIPEVVYSWRMHSSSTAEDAVAKPYIHTSQRAVLQRYLDSTSRSEDYSVEYTPLLNGSADWWLRRRHEKARPVLIVSLGIGPEPGKTESSALHSEYPDLQFVFLPVRSRPEALLQAIDRLPEEDGFVGLVSEELVIDRPDWIWDAIGLAEQHPETVMVGGRIRNSKGTILSAGYCIGFAGHCACPDRGRPAIDPGYFTQMLKQRSVSAISTQFALIQVSFLRDLLAQGISPKASIPFLGAWAGAYALRTGKRIVYSPFLSGVSDLDWDALTSSREKGLFRSLNSDIIPDHRFYPRFLSLKRDSGYQLVS